MEVLLERIATLIWGPYLLIPLLSFVGVFLTLRLRALPWRYLSKSVALFCTSRSSDTDEGDIPPRHALMAALASALGTGNIAGVATAIHLGGVGAIFWMWCIALFGMATQYTEAVLAVRFREKDANGNYVGGPMYYISKGLGRHWHWLGTSFALFGTVAAFGIGNMVQANSVASVLQDNFDVPDIASGAVLAMLTAVVIIGGIRRIGVVAARMVPFISLLYIFSATVVIVLHIGKVPAAFALIIHDAFNGSAATGGFVGATVAQAIRFGLARGIFSNEAGLGSMAIVHAAAKTREPVQQGMIAMLGTFIDTLIVCTMTAMVIILTNSWESGANGAVLTSVAFSSVLGETGDMIVSICMCLFALTTLLGWSYYGERCAQFLFGTLVIKPYRLLWVLVVLVGATSDVKAVWLAADIMNGLMALPNLIALLLLSPLVVSLSKKYLSGSSCGMP